MGGRAAAAYARACLRAGAALAPSRHKELPQHRRLGAQHLEQGFKTSKLASHTCAPWLALFTSTVTDCLPACLHLSLAA